MLLRERTACLETSRSATRARLGSETWVWALSSLLGREVLSQLLKRRAPHSTVAFVGIAAWGKRCSALGRICLLKGSPRKPYDVGARVLVAKWGKVLIIGIRALAADLCHSTHIL